MAKAKTIDDCETPADVEAWAAAEEAPLHAEIADIDAQIVALNTRKRELHRTIDEIEVESARRRYELRGDDAGPDQVLVPSDTLNDTEIERLRRLVDQYDRNR
jgi:N-methylhydantoinase B/oxoprolinase/acetone carboxylase alpha subunit